MARPRQIGRYLLYDAIASGGMASVHFGRLVGPVGFSRTVAIKRLHPHLAGEPVVAAMFLDEARLAARIRHPNVVTTIDVVAADDELFLVLEYVHGESLARLARMREGEPMPPALASAIVIGVLHGLDAAHEAKSERGEPLHLVHRDVSPQNVIVGVDGVARVVDFGVAKAVGRSQTTRDGQLRGKTAYMAPEQLASGTVDRRTDVYAASVILWEILCGRRLFFADDAIQTMCMVLGGKPEPPSTYAPGLPAALDDVVLRGLAPHQDRFASAREMALALELVIPPATVREVGEWVEHHASATMRLRAERVAAIESSSASTASSPLPPTAEDVATRAEVPPRPNAAIVSPSVDPDEPASVNGPSNVARSPADRRVHTWRRYSALAALATVVVMVSWAVLGRKPAAAPAAITVATASTLPALVTATASVAPSSVDPPMTAPRPPPPVPSARTRRAPASPARPPATHRSANAPAPRKPDCAELFTWSAEGKKIPKPECF